MPRAIVSLSVIAFVVALAGCADSTAPRPSKKVPIPVAQTRYILASGEIPPPGCIDVGNGYWECGDLGGDAPQAAARPAVAGEAR